MVKSYVVGGGGGLQDYIVSYLGQVIVIVIGRPRSLTIGRFFYLFEHFRWEKKNKFL